MMQTALESRKGVEALQSCKEEGQSPKKKKKTSGAIIGGLVGSFCRAREPSTAGVNVGERWGGGERKGGRTHGENGL